jgi:glycosyltransferase involved in cell wall biosynthesis
MGVDMAEVAARVACRAPRPAGVPATLVVLARLVPIKGIEVAIDALRQVRTPARLVIAGDGPLREALVRRAAGAAIELVGTVDAAGRDALLARADAVLVPSIATASGRTEGMPLVALEALAAGVPLVATTTGGLADLPPDAAWLVAPGEPQALATAIDAALGAGRPRPGATRVTADLGWDAVGTRLWEHWFAE